MRYSFDKDDILYALKKVGVKKGDILFLFTSLGMLGKPKGCNTIDEICKIFYEALIETVGEEGTIVVPTYSYTIGKSLASEPSTYDPKTTPAEIGPFPEFFRKQPGVIRSLDPMMPIAAIGMYAKKLLKNLPPNSYGKDSVYERLLKYDNAKICNIGLGTNWIPFIHYLDWLHKVPFRYDKLFTGNIKDGYEIKKISWIYPVRAQIEESYPYGYKVGKLSEKDGLWNYINLGKGRIYVCNYRNYFNYINEKMKKDKWILAKGPKVDVEKAENQRLKIKEYDFVLPDFDPIRWIENISALRRDVVSDYTEKVLYAIKEYFPIKLNFAKTGEHVLDWLIPEKWTLYSAKLIDIETRVEICNVEKSPGCVYSYSRPFEGVIEKATLLKHIATHNLIPDARPIINVVNDRDWGFSLTKEEVSNLKGSRYYVKIETDFSFSKLIWGEWKIGTNNKEIVLATYISGVYEANLFLSGLVIGLEIMRRLKKVENKLNYSIRLLILPYGVGLASWIEKNKKKLESNHIEAIINLVMLGKEHIYTIQSVKYNFITKSLEKFFLKNRKDFQIIHHGFFNPLPYGGNPFITNNTLPFYEKILSIGRALPRNSIYFPFYGYNTDLDMKVDANILLKSIEDIYMFLKNYIL